MRTNCVNCGAPLTGSKCQYCGTEYKGNGVVADFGKDDWTGTMSVGGKEYRVYVAKMEQKALDDYPYLDITTGKLHRDILGYKHKFTLIEM